MSRRAARLVARLVVLVFTVALCTLSAPGSAWATTNWVVHLAASSKALARATALPAAPSSITASCAAPTTSKTIKVTWGAVTHATGYSVYQSTTSATGTYTLAASGIATTSWTSGSLTASTNYWFEVVAVVGTNWSSANSSASAESTIHSTNPFCAQP